MKLSKEEKVQLIQGWLSWYEAFPKEQRSEANRYYIELIRELFKEST